MKKQQTQSEIARTALSPSSFSSPLCPLLSSKSQFLARTTEIIKGQNAPRHKHKHTNQHTHTWCFVYCCICNNSNCKQHFEFESFSFAVDSSCMCLDIHTPLCVLFFWISSLGRTSAYTVHVCLCDYLSVFVLVVFSFIHSCFGLAFVIDATIKTAPHRMRAHMHMHAPHVEWFAAPISVAAAHRSIFMLCVNEIHLENFCGAINTTRCCSRIQRLLFQSKMIRFNSMGIRKR